jgi:hypothetical protein
MPQTAGPKIALGSRQTFIRAWRWDDWYVRVGGWGLSVMPLETHRPLLSERTGNQKAWHRLGHCIKPLRPR